jgi:hypothetical protein
MQKCGAVTDLLRNLEDRPRRSQFRSRFLATRPNASRRDGNSPTRKGRRGYCQVALEKSDVTPTSKTCALAKCNAFQILDHTG